MKGTILDKNSRDYKSKDYQGSHVMSSIRFVEYHGENIDKISVSVLSTNT